MERMPENLAQGLHSVAVITGGAGGLGRVAAERLNKDGHTVVLADYSDSVFDACAEMGLAMAVQVDVTDRDGTVKMFEDIVAQHGSLDVVVNSAGVAHRSSFAETKTEEFMTDVRVNLLGTFVVCQAAVFPHMTNAGRGRLINIASASATVGGVGSAGHGLGGRTSAGYASSKAGVVNLTRWIAREVGPFGVTCNTVSPGLGLRLRFVRYSTWSKR